MAVSLEDDFVADDDVKVETYGAYVFYGPDHHRTKSVAGNREPWEAWGCWGWTTNRTEILDAEPSDVLFCRPKVPWATMQPKLLARMPAAHPFLSNHVFIDRASFRQDYGEVQYPNICLFRSPEVYTGADINEVTELAKKFGSVLTTKGSWGDDTAAEYDCFWRPYNQRYGYYELAYDPVVAARRAKRYKERLKTIEQEAKVVRLRPHHLNEVCGSIRRLLPHMLTSTIERSTGYERPSTATGLLERALAVCTLVFGPYSYRRLPAFQVMLDVYRKDTLIHKTANRSKDWASLAKWLAKEAKVKKPRAKKLRPTSAARLAGRFRLPPHPASLR